MVQLVVNKSLESVAYDFVPPIVDGLALWSFLGGDATKSSKNYAAGHVASSVIGSPTFAERYATLLPGTHYLQSDAAQSADLTLVAIARPITESYSHLISNANGPTVVQPPATTRGASLSLQPGTAGDSKVDFAFNQSIKDASNVDQVASVATSTGGATIGSFAMLVGRCVNATSVRTVKNLTNGQSQTATSAFPVNLGTNKFCIGSSVSNNAAPYPNSVDMALAAVWNRALSDAELSTLYTWAKAYYANRGITI